ncbi:MAG TPA: M20/M25/M40 family metallo-hydrolase [Acidimicrobiia bacterium]|nr:M20/M25/M40 family metallo-hydrolase [Acidimicrobiia bacterium]
MTTGKKGMRLIAGAGLGAAAATALRRRWAGRRGPAAPEAPVLAGAGRALLDHLAEAVQIRTISREDRSLIDWAPFAEFHAFLERTYPLVHRELRREVVADHSLLYTWEGADPAALPVLLMGHLDVVGVEPGTEADWDHPPFAGERDEEYLWGRGSIDDKGSVIALFESVEGLLADGFRPDVTLHLAIGHDEEIGGTEGAAAVSALLASRGVRLDFVLDEGGAVVTGFLPGLNRPVALLGIGEKGYLNLELIAGGGGGHSSVPPPHTTIGLLAAAVGRLEAAPMPARLDVQGGFFAALAPAMGRVQGLALRHLDRLGPLVERRLSALPAGNALIRTTSAVTMIEGGVKPNQLPQSARAVANFRVIPGDTVDGVLAHARKVVGEGITVGRVEGGFSAEPSRLADTESASYRLVAETIEEVFPGAAVAPWIVMGATDARHYLPVAENVFRFSPFRFTPEDMSRMHGTGERMCLTDADGAVAFYRRLVMRACGAG